MIDCKIKINGKVNFSLKTLCVLHACQTSENFLLKLDTGSEAIGTVWSKRRAAVCGVLPMVAMVWRNCLISLGTTLLCSNYHSTKAFVLSLLLLLWWRHMGWRVTENTLAEAIALEIIHQTEANSMGQHNVRVFLPLPVFPSRRRQILKQTGPLI